MRMRCDCGEKAVYHRRYSGQRFCKGCFTGYFERKVAETIREHKMIRKGERIGVALSGGKDSTVLLHVLSALALTKGFELIAIAVDEGIRGYREEGLKAAAETCRGLGVQLEVKSFEELYGTALDRLVEKGELKPCSYCGVLRRSALNKIALDMKLDKLALGHNLDDEAQTVLMNIITGNVKKLHRMAGGAVKTVARRIKPLRNLPEKEIMLYALLRDLRFSSLQCPYADQNMRTRVREFLNRLEDENPGVKFSVIKGWEKIVMGVKVKGGVKTCHSCGEPSAGDRCRACQLMEEIKIKMSEGKLTLAD